jgi:hypothetical protein
VYQAARKSQKKLVQQVAQLQAQPPQAPQPTAAPDSAAPAAARDSLPDPQQQQLLQHADTVQLQDKPSQPASAANALQPSRRCSRCRSSKHASSVDDVGSTTADETWQAVGALDDFGCATCSVAGCAGPGQLLCMSADQLALMSSRQGRAQAQLELVQQQLQKQQVRQALVVASSSLTLTEAGVHAAFTPVVGGACAACSCQSCADPYY